MEAIATDFGIKEALSQLGVKAINEGTSTGSNNFSNGDIIESYSPVDGKLIGKVKTTTRADYDKVMDAATSAFLSWKQIKRFKRASRKASIIRNG